MTLTRKILRVVKGDLQNVRLPKPLRMLQTLFWKLSRPKPDDFIRRAREQYAAAAYVPRGAVSQSKLWDYNKDRLASAIDGIQTARHLCRYITAATDFT